MKVVSFSCKIYDRQQLCRTLPADWKSEYVEPALDKHTVVYAKEADVITAFVNDQLDASILETLASYGVKMVALRCAGFNNVDLEAAQKLGIAITRVPAYKAYNRGREGNFALNGMLGFDFFGKTVGIIGAGKIGRLVGERMKAFGCEVLVYDPYLCEVCDELGLKQVELDEIYESSDVISLHCPLTPETNHLIDKDSIAKMKKGVMLINTSRGGLMDPESLIGNLKYGQIGYLAMDVYEKEGALFFEDHSCEIIQDDIFERLLTFPNVLVTGHQAYFTQEALSHIAETTRDNIQALIDGAELVNRVEV